MPNQPPEFTHIHSSSKAPWSAASLEDDLDEWIKQASIITLTEIGNDRRAAAMREKGWDYYNAKKHGGADNCGICWDKSVWARVWGGAQKLHTVHYMRPQAHKPTGLIHSASVILKHKKTGFHLLVTVTHMPAWVQQGNHLVSSGYDWLNRKRAYMTSMTTWSTWVKHQVRNRKKIDGVLVCSDWNVDLKAGWFRDYLRQNWGKKYVLTWKHFPTLGSIARHGKMIDGSLVYNLRILEGGAKLMPKRGSSDHHPYRERLGFTRGTIPGDDNDDSDGDTRPGVAWWGFGDYTAEEEQYDLARATGERGGVVL